jgi:hypothetical protein
MIDKIKIISLHSQNFLISSIKQSLNRKYSEYEIVKVIAESEITMENGNLIIPSILNYPLFYKKTIYKKNNE